MCGHLIQRRFCVRQGQQIIVVGWLMGRPCQMLTEQSGLIAIMYLLEACQVFRVQRNRPTDGQTHTM
ncbi:hypothetical protein AY586_16230 [Marichromatium gracile]|uniref:Uncharacterized protein n=1 Tax=Marichromatium gracile TaxID=1048 RepID=A0ABR5VEE7_MARGR|nr:hypothetical protein AY586_16230 [Marichromatium gracile]